MTEEQTKGGLIMTDEQIKQNALKSEKEHGNFNYQYQGEAFNKGYIAGAHSRDEEINELKDRIERQKAIISFDDLNEEALRKELNQLRNPWISVEERTPEDNMVVLLWLGGCYKVALLRDKKWWECTGWNIEGGRPALDALSTCEVEYITHWMPIPEV